MIEVNVRVLASFDVRYYKSKRNYRLKKIKVKWQSKINPLAWLTYARNIPGSNWELLKGKTIEVRLIRVHVYVTDLSKNDHTRLCVHA